MPQLRWAMGGVALFRPRVLLSHSSNCYPTNPLVPPDAVRSGVGGSTVLQVVPRPISPSYTSLWASALSISIGNCIRRPGLPPCVLLTYPPDPSRHGVGPRARLFVFRGAYIHVYHSSTGSKNRSPYNLGSAKKVRSRGLGEEHPPV